MSSKRTLEKSQSVKKTTSSNPSSTKHKEEIEVLNEGPIYICEYCHAMLKVPDELLKETEIEEEDEDGPYLILEVTYECPRCNECNIVSEEEIEDDFEDESPKKSKSDKKSNKK